MRTMHLLTISAIVVLLVVCTACDEPVYQGAGEARPLQQQDHVLQGQPHSGDTGERRTSTSTYGKAMDAGRRTADRLEEHDRRIADEIPDY